MSFCRYVVMKLLSSTKKIRKSKETYFEVMKGIVDDHIKTFDPDSLRDYIDAYLQQAQKLESSGETNHSFTSK